jgi:hypothetical protein
LAEGVAISVAETFGSAEMTATRPVALATTPNEDAFKSVAGVHVWTPAAENLNAICGTCR